MNENSPKADFCISVDFEKNSRDPSRVFRTITELIESFGKFDHDLVESIQIKIEPVLLLEDIESGSIKVWLKTVLEKVDDEAIKNLDWRPQIGKYLVKAKYVAIDFLSERTTITDKSEMDDLREKMFNLAKETDIKHIPSFAPVPLHKIAENIKNISSSISHLSKDDKAKYITPYGETFFNINFNYSPEKIEELLTEKTINNQQEMIIKVKRPDYLGTAKWEFRYDGRNIDAKIMDTEWLKNFQSRMIDVRPGDALRALVEITSKYDSSNEVISRNHQIIKVVEVIPGTPWEQESLF